MNNLLIILFACALTACSAVHRIAPCTTNDGAGIVEGRGGPTPSISSCALFRRQVDAFEERSAELGCTALFPLDTNPLTDNFEGCFAWQADQHADWLRLSIDCDLLLARVSNLENYAGFECGGARCFAPPYFEHRRCGTEPCGRGPCGR